MLLWLLLTVQHWRVIKIKKKIVQYLLLFMLIFENNMFIVVHILDKHDVILTSALYLGYIDYNRLEIVLWSFSMYLFWIICKICIAISLAVSIKQLCDGLLTIFVHCGQKAFGKSTRPALVTMGFVHRTSAFQLPCSFTRIYPVTVDAALKESRTTCKISSVINL